MLLHCHLPTGVCCLQRCKLKNRRKRNFIDVRCCF